MVPSRFCGSYHSRLDYIINTTMTIIFIPIFIPVLKWAFENVAEIFQVRKKIHLQGLQLTSGYDIPIISKEQHSKRNMDTQERRPCSQSFTLG